jgi:Ala-tRNA(Pro) deacylase
MPVEKLKKLLDAEHIRYVSIRHSQAFTAQEIAAAAAVPGRELAKTVIVRLDGDLAMAVLPASYQVGFERLREATGAELVELASEEEFKYRFPNCEIGAMPPFGVLYDMPVYVDASLTEDDQIAFNAGSHVELIQLAYSDFARLVKPTVLDFGVQCE